MLPRGVFSLDAGPGLAILSFLFYRTLAFLNSSREVLEGESKGPLFGVKSSPRTIFSNSLTFICTISFSVLIVPQIPFC